MAMVTAAAERKDIINGAFSDTLSRKSKEKAWDEITFAVNAVGQTRRDSSAVRKKFRDYRSDVKRKLGRHKLRLERTGKTKLPFIAVST